MLWIASTIAHSFLLLSATDGIQVPNLGNTNTWGLVAFTVSIKKVCSLYWRRELSHLSRMLVTSTLLRNDLGKK